MRIGPEQARRRDGLTEWSQDDPQRRHHASRADLVPGQALPDRRDDDERCHQRQPEHRVTTHQQREPWLAGRRVRQQQGTRRSRHHGRHNRHQPTAERRVFPHLVRGEDEEGDCDRRDEPGRGSGQPQQPVERERGVQTDPVPAHEQRSGSDREQRHRRCAVEMRHDRVVNMTAGGRGMPSPMHGSGDAHDDEQGGGQRLHRSRERPQPGYVDRQSRGRHCHDPGAHHRRVPVRSDRRERLGSDAAGHATCHVRCASPMRSWHQQCCPGGPAGTGQDVVGIQIRLVSGRCGRAGRALPRPAAYAHRATPHARCGAGRPRRPARRATDQRSHRRRRPTH